MYRNKRIFITLFSVIIFLTTGFPIHAGYDNFTFKQKYENFYDVSDSDWFYSNVKTVYQLNLMNGVSSDYFKPHSNVTVAEAVTLAVRLFEIYHEQVYTPTNYSSPWFQKYIDTAIDLKILNKDYFEDYNAPIIRADFAGLFSPLLPLEESKVLNPINLLDIPDLDDGVYLADLALSMYQYGIMIGDSSLSFRPKSFISRAEVATIISRLAKPEFRQKLNIFNTITAEKHIERPYEWFVDQNFSGQHSMTNCGPAVTSMILKWYNPSYNFSAESLREAILPNGEGWTTDTISRILMKYQIPKQVHSFKSVSQIVDELNKDHIVLVCLDGYYFSEFYDQPNSGHFVIIKGYTNQNGLIRFETYNPDSRKNAYYFADNIKKAADIWWDYFISIGQ